MARLALRHHLLLTLAYVGGCNPPPETTTSTTTTTTTSTPRDTRIGVRFDPTGTGFFATPWPSDHRRRSDGTVDLTGFPNLDQPYVGAVRAAIEGHVRGFSTMPVGYFELTLDPGDDVLLQPLGSLAPGAAVTLVSVEPGHCGEPVPVEMRINRADDPYLPVSTLEVAPVWGFPLRRGARYAFVVREGFGGPAGLATKRPEAWAAALVGGATGPIAEALAPLRACAAGGGLALDDVAVATVFTVQDVLAEARALRDAVADPGYVAAPVISGWTEDVSLSGDGFTAYTASYQTPIFQEGDAPYDHGGDILFDAEGRPILQRWERVPMIVLVPDGLGPSPLVLWEGGTGWQQWGQVDKPLTQELLGAGFAVASFMPQFHGERGTPGADPELHTYNIMNPSAGRNVLRQQMTDTSYFVRVLREAVPQQVGTSSIELSVLRFGGHSQGAQSGAMVAAVEPALRSFVLNGLASYFTVTLLERKDHLDIEALLKILLAAPGELDRFHPALAVLQLGADSVDFHNYAAAWRGWEGKPEGAHLFVLNGYNDPTAHHEGIEAITIAGDLAPIEPPGWDVDWFGVWDRAPEVLPIAGNRVASDGGPLTQATYLDAETGHHTIDDRPAERARAVAFLVDATNAVPTLAP